MQTDGYLIICGVATTFYSLFKQVHHFAYFKIEMLCVTNIIYESKAKHNKYSVKFM